MDEVEFECHWSIDVMGASPLDAAMRSEEVATEPTEMSRSWFVRNRATDEFFMVDLATGEVKKVG